MHRANHAAVRIHRPATAATIPGRPYNDPPLGAGSAGPACGLHTKDVTRQCIRITGGYRSLTYVLHRCHARERARQSEARRPVAAILRCGVR